MAALRARPGGRRPAGDDEIAEALRTAVSDMGGGGRDQAATPRAVPAYSLAGGQPKIALTDIGGRWHVPTGTEPSTHILKPPPGGTGDQAANEHLCLATARRLGLAAADCHEPAAGTFPARYAAAVAHWQQHCLDALTTTPHPRPRRPGSGLGLSCVA